MPLNHKNMKTIKLVLWSAICLPLCFGCSTSSENSDEDVNGAKYVSVKSTTCEAPSDWFNLVNGTRKTVAPNEGSSSVFANNATVSNCDFHAWSWQKFLFLTSYTNGKPFFLDSLMQVSAIGTQLSQNQGIQLTDVGQASSATDILKTNPDFGKTQKSDTVYYSIHMNDLMYNTIQKFAPIAKMNPALVKNQTFPVGSLELKISWVNVRSLADSSTYFITDGLINGKKARIALLGMHVVGVIENHPEFVWATFEHEKLAPDYNWSAATPSKDAPVSSTNNYLLFNKNANATVKNITTGNGIYTNVFSVYKFGVPVEKAIKGTADVQLYMETSQPGAENFNNIRTINQSVKTQLSGIWDNYFYNGSVWINTAGFPTNASQASLLDSLGGNLSSSKKGDITRGSVSAYNITMETYVQVGFAPASIHKNSVGNLVNCLTCHNASGNKNNLSPLYISHIFTGYLKTLQGATPKQVKQQHVDEIKAFFLKRAKTLK
jgi:hypothetical protein